MSCGVGRRRRSDLALLWLWHRLAAVALTCSLVWESPYARGVVLKKKKKKKKAQRECYVGWGELSPIGVQGSQEPPSRPEGTETVRRGFFFFFFSFWPPWDIWSSRRDQIQAAGMTYPAQLQQHQLLQPPVLGQGSNLHSGAAEMQPLVPQRELQGGSAERDWRQNPGRRAGISPAGSRGFVWKRCRQRMGQSEGLD